MTAPLLILVAPYLLSLTKTQGRAFDEFEFFDRKENLIHIFSEEIFGMQEERNAIIQEGEAITWGWEWFDENKGKVEDILDGSEISLEVDGRQILPEDGRGCWSEIKFFQDGFDHDGDGFGDGDADGIGDVPRGFVAAFRFTTVLSKGVHRWVFQFTDRTGLVVLRDSGTITVLENWWTEDRRCKECGYRR